MRLLVICIFICLPFISIGATCTYTGTWDCGTPGTGDDLIISSGTAVLTLGWSTAASITVNSGATLSFSGGSPPNNELQIKNGGILIVNSGGTLDVTGDVDFQNGSSIQIDGTFSVDGDFNNSNNSDQVVINGSMSVTGDFTNGTGGDITGSGSITASGTITNNGTIGGSTGNDFGTLPVDLLTFKAGKYESGVIVYWETATELNNDHFILERSYDGTVFWELARIQGAGSSSRLMAYQFVDSPPAFGQIIYRLTQVDYDGTTEEFPWISILFENPAGSQIHLFPNRLSAESQTVFIKNIWGGIVHYDLVLVSLNGETDHRINVHPDLDYLTIEFESRFSPGLYILKGDINGVPIREKILISY